MQKGGGASADEAYSISVDGNNNTYTTGYFTGTASFGSFNLTASGVSDIFVAQTNSNGVYQWVVKAGDGGSDRGLAITSDASGNSYVTGYYYGTATFGIYTITSAGLQDAFIAKYNSAGVVQWVVSGGGTQSDIGNAIALDNSGNVIVTGQFAGTAHFGSYTLTSTANNVNVFTAKLDGSTGTFLWAESGTGHHTDKGLGVGCDGSGNIYVTGQFTDTITFSSPHSSTLNNAIFIVKYNSAGVEQWITTAGGGTSNIANGIAVDNNSNVYITGNFTGTLTFFANNNIALTQTYINRIFIAKYDQNANLLWDVADGSSNSLTSNAIALDGSGNAYITGNFECVMNSYADRYGQGTFNTVGYWDIFNAEYSSSNGAWQWSRQIGGHKNNYGYGIAVSSAGNVFDAGSFDQDMIITDAPPLSGYNVTSGSYCTPSYCSDADYGDYAYFNTAGDLDAFIASPINLSRQTYDFYDRSGNSCSRPVIPVCIGTANVCEDTVQFCSSGTVQVIPNSCSVIGPSYTYLWSSGATTSTVLVTRTGMYSVTQTSRDSCLSTKDSIYVIIHPRPSLPDISDNVVINTNSNNPKPIRVCQHSVVLTGSNYAGDSTWYWTTPNNTRINGATITVGLNADSGDYCFHVVSNYGCTNSICVWVAIDSTLPKIVPKLACLTCKHDTAFLCKGSGFTMLPYDSLSNPGKNPALCISYASNHWSLLPNTATYSAVTNCPDGNTIIPINYDSGWYNVTDTIFQSNACGNKKYILEEPIYVRIYPIPIVTLHIAGNTLLCPGDSEWIVGSGNVSFKWSNNSTKDSIYVGPGTYSITASVTNAYGCTTTGSASIHITTFTATVPTITMNPPNGVYCPNDSVELTCHEGPYQSYQWYGPSGPLPINDSMVYVKVPGNYYCVGVDTTPCSALRLSNTVTIQSYITPFLQVPPITNFCPGDSIILKVVASAGAVIQWQAPLNGDSITQIIKTPGTYSVKITSCGITTNCSTIITESNPVASITASPSKSICTVGDSVKLSGLPHMADYLWHPGNDTNQIMYVKLAGTYTLNTIDTFGCSASADVVISPPILDSIVKAISIKCKGDNTGLITLGVKGGESPYTYSWQPPQGSSATASNLSAGSYTVTVVDASGCTKTMTVTLTQPAASLAYVLSDNNIACFGNLTGFVFDSVSGGTSPYTYMWSPGNQTSASITGLGVGSYSVTVTDLNGCKNSASVTLTQPPVLDVYINEPQTICKDSTGDIFAHVTGGVQPYTYTWSAGINSTTSTATVTLTGNLNFSVTVTDKNGCTATAAITLGYGPPLTVSASGNTTFCIGDSTTICANESGGVKGITYLWQPGNKTTPCITVHPLYNTIYTIVVADGCGVTATAPINLAPQPKPVVNMAAFITQGCAPLCVQFQNMSTLARGGISEYLWTFTKRGGNIYDSSTIQSENPIYCYESSGVYNVKLTVISDSGCSATLAKPGMINVFSTPQAAFTFYPQPVSILTPTVQFTDKSTDSYGNIVYWRWTFGDATDSSSYLKNPVHTYQDTGVYCPKLIVSNANGCIDSITDCLVMEPAFTLYIPSAFTPNDDGLNEVFQPKGQYIKNFEMYIFDRWGMQLYHTTDISKGWNGTMQGSGSICMEDSYVYKITVTDSQGNQHSYIGSVTLLK